MFASPITWLEFQDFGIYNKVLCHVGFVIGAQNFKCPFLSHGVALTKVRFKEVKVSINLLYLFGMNRFQVWIKNEIEIFEVVERQSIYSPLAHPQTRLCK